MLVCGALAGVLCASSLSAQTAIIRGTVTDSATRTPLQGASITIPGTPLRAATDAGGQYVIRSVPAGQVLVRVQMIGSSPVERSITVDAGADLVVDFALVARVRELEEIVAVGYGTEQRGELTTAVSSVSGADIANQPVASLDAALQGKAAGVQVTQNAGNPGNDISVRIRGTASISAGSQPLYVVDGVPIVSTDISQLDAGGQGITALGGISPDDIESIDVLKDAAATAIYGSRGSNGVVMITTKRGLAGRTTVTFNTYVGTQSASKRLDMMSSAEYLAFKNQAAENDGYGADYFGTPGVADALNTDWQSAVFRHAPVGNAELAVTGGDARLRYRVSGNWFGQDGIVIGSAFRRFGGRANLDFNPNGRLSLSTSLAVSGEKTDRIFNDGSEKGIVTNAIANNPGAPVRRDDGTFASDTDGLIYPNPVALATLNSFKARTTRIIGNAAVKFRPIDAVVLTSRVGIDLLNLREDQFESGRVENTYAFDARGVAKSGYSTGDRYVFDNFVTLTPRLGERHGLTATAGASIELNRGELNFIRGEGFSNDAFTQVRNATTLIEGDATNTENNLVSFFTRANYSLAGKYLFGASIRTDGSSKFGPSNRWGVFPSGSAAWVMSEESFLRGSRALSFAKLRASYGLTGNQPTTDFPFQGLSATSNYGAESGLIPSTLPNPNLKWERTAQLDVGADLAFGTGRVTLTADYYRKKTRDLLLDRPVSGTSGFTSVFDNVGNVENNGIELSLTTAILEAHGPNGFGWTTTLNVARNRNKVTALFNDEPFTGGERSINRVEVGQPIGMFYTLKFLGVDPATGDAIYDDLDGDGSITSADRQIVGNPHPDFTGGFASTFTYKGFDLTAFLTFSKGNDVFNAMRLFSGATGYYSDNEFRDQLARWQNPGDITNVPRASYDGTSGAQEISSRFIEDGSYLRMQDLTLGFRFPDRLAGSLGFRSARLYGSVRNLFTISNYTGYSPDVNSNGALANVGLGTDFYAYPQARTFTFGVQAAW